MTALPILIDPYSNPVLRQTCRPIGPSDWPDAFRLAGDLRDTVLSVGGLGLAAPQVGRPLRVIAIGDVLPGRHHRVMMNPEVTGRRGGTETAVESCLSLPGVSVRVRRHRRVRVRFLDLDGQPREHWYAGLLARCLQHEIDHLDGVLITDPR